MKEVSQETKVNKEKKDPSFRLSGSRKDAIRVKLAIAKKKQTGQTTIGRIR